MPDRAVLKGIDRAAFDLQKAVQLRPTSCVLSAVNPEEDKDALWELLGKAKTPSVSPFFARNVLRQIRVSPHPGLFGWLVRHWRLASVGVAALIVAAGLSLNFVRPSEKTYPSDIAQLVANNPDYDVIVHLDELLAYEESALWLDGLPE